MSDARADLVKTIREVGFATVVALILLFRIAPALDALAGKIDKLSYLVEHGTKIVGVKR